jgi:protein TonB
VYQGAAAAPAPAPNPSPDNKPELLGYQQTASHSEIRLRSKEGLAVASEAPADKHEAERKQEAALFSYIDGRSETPQERSPSRFRIGKGAICAASLLAIIAIVAAPQAPWHSRLKIVLSNAQHSFHKWLNPQPVTAVSQAPTSHEDFGRAGDEYKLPVAETIPDATTDPSQIQVVPAIDPTAKKPATDTANPDQGQPATDTNPNPAQVPEASQTPAVQAPENPPAVQPAPAATSPATLSAPTSAPTSTTAIPTPAAPSNPPHSETTTVLTTPAPSNAAPPGPPPRRQPSQYVPPTTKVPSSLQSQMATMVPEASGNKPVDAAMPAIEPVDVSEMAERALLTDQPSLNYPPNVRGQQGTVILQVLIGRDGAVQDAKFVQGSLAFARPAIDGVKQWRFKPYTMNGRPVSVQTNLTIKFKPAQ